MTLSIGEEEDPSVRDQEAGAGAGGGLPAAAGAAPSYRGARPEAGSCPVAVVPVGTAPALLQSLTAQTKPSWLTPQSPAAPLNPKMKLPALARGRGTAVPPEPKLMLCCLLVVNFRASMHLPTLMSTLFINSSASSSSVQDDPIATPCMFSRLPLAGAAAPAAPAAALLPASTVFRPIRQPWSYHTCTSCRRCCFAASPAVSSNHIPQVPLPNTPLVLLKEAHCAFICERPTPSSKIASTALPQLLLHITPFVALSRQ